MPIPPFDGILNVLPPHLGDPAQRGSLSPYSCTTEELCQRFAVSPGRKTILEGLLKLRGLARVGNSGLSMAGRQFLEDIETQRGTGAERY